MYLQAVNVNFSEWKCYSFCNAYGEMFRTIIKKFLTHTWERGREGGERIFNFIFGGYGLNIDRIYGEAFSNDILLYFELASFIIK